LTLKQRSCNLLEVGSNSLIEGKSKMARLTPTEKKAITAASNKASKALTGKNTPAEDLDKVFAVAEGLKGRDKPPIIGKEAVALWQAKIDFAIANGDNMTLAALTKFPASADSLVNRVINGGKVAFWDNNGGCSCGGGGGGPAGW
jgi:hypothetical protein